MTYRTEQLQFQLPDADVQDASINILKFPALGTSLIISRSLLADGETLQSNFEGQLKRMEQQIQDLRFQPPAAVQVGRAHDVPAFELRSQFSKGAEKVFQYQLALVVPGTRQMLALSYVKPQPLGEAEAAHWQAIKQTLALQPPA
ncbi:DcrB-related protein [Pseudomonas sp. App30]|uniref:DcrB-related protein n=1 Tax=Pseudomonas sp. App30 TaxID=3068990 RepID=UPI003A808BE8